MLHTPSLQKLMKVLQYFPQLRLVQMAEFPTLFVFGSDRNMMQGRVVGAKPAWPIAQPCLGDREFTLTVADKV